MADEPVDAGTPAPVTTPDEALVAEFARRYPDKAEPAKADESKADVGPEGKVAEEVEPAAKPDPNAAPAEDLSHVPEQFRSVFASMPAEARQWVKDNAWGKPEFTRKTQELAEQRKAFEAEREKHREAAEFGSKFLGDEEALDHFVEWSKQRKSNAAPKEKSPARWAPSKAWDEMTSDEITTTMNSLIEEAEKRAEARAESRAKAEVEAKVTGPQKRDAGILRALGGLIGDSASATDVKSAFLLARDHYARIGVLAPEQWNEQNTPGLVEPFLALAKATAAPSKPEAANGSVGGAEAQRSPLARGAAAVEPVPMPSHMKEKRAPKTRQELIAETLYEVSKHEGRKVGLNDLDAAWGRPSR